MDSSFIIKALEGQYKPDRYATFPELRIGTGYGGKDVEQRIDLWVMGYWPSMGIEKIAFEVKVSRSDFKSEIRQRLKRRPALLVSNRFYFACPQGLVRPDEIPTECGLIEITEEGKVLTTITAPYRDVAPVNFHFLASICRRAAKAEEEAMKKLQHEAAVKDEADGPRLRLEAA